METEGYAREQFRPTLGKPQQPREQQKAALQDAYLRKGGAGGCACSSSAGTGCGSGRVPQANARPAVAQSDEAELHKAISAEIVERQQFLTEMRGAGSYEHEAAVQAQVADRMADLRRLEKLMADHTSSS